MIIGLDFDGTVVTHAYPAIGKPVRGALRVLRRLVSRGDQIILWTIRSGPELAAAIEYLESAGIELWGVNENPEQAGWSQSPKAYCQVYIDDAALGCPLVWPDEGRPYVDWLLVERLLFPAADGVRAAIEAARGGRAPVNQHGFA